MRIETGVRSVTPDPGIYPGIPLGVGSYGSDPGTTLIPALRLFLKCLSELVYGIQSVGARCAEH